MTLGDLIAELEKHDPAKVVPLGFRNPHSYRGWYELAFEPAENVTVAEMLVVAREALGTTYQGYTMHSSTDCYLANWGDCGEEIGPTFLRLLLASPSEKRARLLLQDAIDFHARVNDCCGREGTYDYRPESATVGDCLWCADAKELLRLASPSDTSTGENADV